LGVGTREQAQRWIAEAGLDPQIRPERLGPEEFAALARAREHDPDRGAPVDAPASAEPPAPAEPSDP
jgi:16S rRNA (adenine1518-N6/adenine1519-N6)-dimethyltransferase